MLATDGCFYNDAAFMVCPPPDTSELEKLFRYEVFKMLKAEGKITDVIIYDMKNRRHSGFNVYCRSQNMSCQGGPQLNESAIRNRFNPESKITTLPETVATAPWPVRGWTCRRRSRAAGILRRRFRRPHRVPARPWSL